MSPPKRAVRILRRAQDDLIDILEYIGRDRPHAAARIMEQLLDAIETLEIYPGRGVEPEDRILRRRGYRVLIVGDYLIFYKVLPKQVRVYRVLHGRRKYSHLL